MSDAANTSVKELSEAEAKAELARLSDAIAKADSTTRKMRRS